MIKIWTMFDVETIIQKNNENRLCCSDAHKSDTWHLFLTHQEFDRHHWTFLCCSVKINWVYTKNAILVHCTTTLVSIITCQLVKLMYPWKPADCYIFTFSQSPILTNIGNSGKENSFLTGRDLTRLPRLAEVWEL